MRTYSDPLERPRSESLATHQRKYLRALQTRATRETRLVGKDVPPLQSVKLIG